MARYTKNGPNVTNTHNGYTVTWYCKQVTDITVKATTVDVTINVYAHFVNAAQIFAGYLTGVLYVDNNVVNRETPQTDEWPSNDEDWNLITRKITYTRGTSATTHTINSYVTVASGSAWAGTSSTYNNQLTITVPALPSYKVYFNANGGSGAPSAQTKYYERALTLSSTRPTRTGHTFRGWGESATTTTVRFNPGGTYTDNAGITLYAVWAKNSYTLTYNANGGSVSPSSVSRDYQAAYGALPTPTREGYTFLGWYTSATDGNAVSPSTTMGAGNTTIYAHWERAYTAPTVLINEAKRVGSNHAEDDTGTIAYVKFTWSSGDNAGTPISPSTYDIILTEQTDVNPEIVSVTGQAITTSPIEVYFDDIDQAAVIDTERSYDVKVILHITEHDDVTATSYIAQAYFIIDINKDGTAIGFGGAVQDEDEGFYCYMPAHFDKGINIPAGQKYKINGEDLSASDIGAVPTTRTVNGKPLSANVSDADYITSQGAESGWYYRKWKSGRVEAWGILTFSARAGSAWGSFYYSDIDVSIPSVIFTEAPIRAYATGSNFQWWALGVTISSATLCRVRMVKPVSSSQAGGIYLYLFSA